MTNLATNDLRTEDEHTARAGPTESAESDEGSDEPDTSHLDDVEPGAGCTEIWEHLAEKREE
ncbi:hypothetical protein OB919_07960 [Halobacteria archaeon AArc-curdl1]|uniref:Uncharacterized protein n=1 Tax=Natronosalvus hydrolyticus TaxID=2979988 RepID=A0AAP3E6K2_9EURY|nr:hypothetical protein [Halobacteria archaeon AArc-curdl1]